MRTVDLALLWLVACGGSRQGDSEGLAQGDCADAADNDGDGVVDCTDDGCAAHPDCLPSDPSVAPNSGSTGTGSPVNQAPTPPTVRIDPAEPTDDDDLLCVVEVSSVDPEGERVTYSYAWSRNGLDAGVPGERVLAERTAVEDQWTCLVSASDGERESPSGSVSVSIAAPCVPGSSAACAAVDCAEVAAAGVVASGLYWIQTSGGLAAQTACDLQTDGGGWTAMFLAETPEYDSETIDYTLDAPGLLASASDVLLGFVDASGAGTTDWAIFPMPADWRLASPMTYTSSSTNVAATFADGTWDTRTLYYGYWNFYSNCGYWQPPDEAITQGRVGFCDAGAPLFTSFSNGSTWDACNAWAGLWFETPCTVDRRFAIFVR